MLLGYIDTITGQVACWRYSCWSGPAK